MLTSLARNELKPGSSFGQDDKLIEQRVERRVRADNMRERAFQLNAQRPAQLLRVGTKSRIGEAAQPDPSRFPTFQLLQNRRERRRYAALRHLHPDVAVVLNKWIGQVESIDHQTFSARLLDADRNNVLEIVEFDSSEVSDNDLLLLKPGAVFYWYILLEEKSGEKRHTSLLWFRRLGRASLEARRAASAKYDEIWKDFGWNEQPRDVSKI